jgi:hypothetical protein
MSALVTLPLAGSIVITQTPLPVILERRASYGYSGRGALVAITFAEDMDIGPTAFGLAIGATGLVEAGCLGGGVGFSSTNSGFCSGIASGGGGGGGSSSGGGVGCGSCCCSSDISTAASGMSVRSTIFSFGWMEAIATAAK